MTPLNVRIEASLELRRASSDCCGARLDADPYGWLCRSCGGPCVRVMSEPETIEVSNG